MKLTHFSVDSRMLLNHHIQWMHLQGWRLCCLNVNPNAVNDVMVSMHHLVFDGYCYRPIEDIANFLNSNSKEKNYLGHLLGYVSCYGIASATAGSVRNNFSNKFRYAHILHDKDCFNLSQPLFCIFCLNQQALYTKERRICILILYCLFQNYMKSPAKY